MDRSPELNELFKALSSAQGEIRDAVKDKENPYFGSQYADMAAALQASREVLAKYGLCVIQLPAYDAAAKVVNINTIVGHSSGQSLSEVLQMPVAQPTAQGVGSAITYGRRYAYMAAVGIAPDDDDDGNLASGRTPQQAKAQQPRPEQQQRPPQQRPQPQKPQQHTGAKQVPQDAKPQTPITQTQSGDVPPRIAQMITEVKHASDDERQVVLGRVVGELYTDLCEVVGDEAADQKTTAIMHSVGIDSPSEITRPSQLRTVLVGLLGAVQQGMSGGAR